MARPASSSGSDGAACATHATDSTAPAITVHRRAPMRSASTPAGTETASVASPGSASSRPVSEGLSPYCEDRRGSSGTIAAWATPQTRNRP
jgi:hypothetical protein